MAYNLAKSPGDGQLDLTERFVSALRLVRTALDDGRAAGKLSEWTAATAL